jgi:lipoprotein-releasing system ATP-binding protein
VFQFHHLLPEFTALENVCIPGWLAGRNKNDVKAKAEGLLKILGLVNRNENKPNQLSGGEQQRVAVARALINDPDIVFATSPQAISIAPMRRNFINCFLTCENNSIKLFLL